MSRQDELQWCYETLGISMNASWEEIRRAYRALAQRYHPDRQLAAEHGDTSSERFKDISRAFRILSDYVKKNGGLPPREAVHRQAPEPDPAVDTGEVYHAWRESFRQHGTQAADTPPPVTMPKRRRYRRAAMIVLPALAIYLFFSFSSQEDEHAIDARWTEDVYTPPAVRTDIPAYIRTGLDMDTVRLIQGEPTRKSGDTWYYGESRIFFEDGKVSGWEMDLAYPLRVDLGQREQSAVPRFTYGASRLEVEAVQGRPTAKEGDVWIYGLSRVYFEDGLVVRWENDPRTPLLVYE